MDRPNLSSRRRVRTSARPLTPLGFKETNFPMTTSNTSPTLFAIAWAKHWGEVYLTMPGYRPLVA
eukprot:14051358-Heterocapsa_arctica.AAC.1